MSAEFFATVSLKKAERTDFCREGVNAATAWIAAPTMTAIAVIFIITVSSETVGF